MPKAAQTACALKDVSRTRGLLIVKNAAIEDDTRFAISSGRDRAMRLGTSSPITIEKYETITVISAVASMCDRCGGIF